MNQLFLGVFVTLVSSLSFAKPSAKIAEATWPKEIVSNLQAKNPYQAFCKEPAGVQTARSCQAFSKLKDSKQKWPKATISEGIITLNDGKRTVQLKRTKEATRFEINNKVIDLANHRDGQSLYRAIAELTPKVAKGSFWMNAAYAEWYPEDATTYDLMSVAAHQIVSSTSDSETCKAAYEFTKQCAVNIDTHSENTLFRHFANKLSDGSSFSPDDQRMFLSSIENLRYELYRMRNLTKGFDKKTDALVNCPSRFSSTKNTSAANDVIECAKTLEDGIRDMQVLQDVVEATHVTEKMNEVKAEVQTYTNKPTSGKTSPAVKKAEGTR